jgi:Flp pilus assembly protein TadD
MQDAQRLISAGDLATAESVYDRLLERNPADRTARLRRGQVRSWQGDYSGAEADLIEVLGSEPTNTTAINALGYNHAWRGDQISAQQQFRRALSIDPNNADATRGMAYSALWNNDPMGASTWFRRAIALQPDDPELMVGLGQAELRGENRTQARRAFRAALEADPARAEASNALDQIRDLPPTAQVTAWAGVNFFGGDGDGETNTGIRLAELALQPSDNIRLWLQLDNGLSLDNIIFSRSRQNVPSYYIGGFANYEKNFTTRIETGYRSLDSAVFQWLLRSEQVIILPSKQAVKLGFWMGSRSDDRNEWIVHAALRVPINKNFHLEPALFYSRSGIPEEFQWRALMSGEYTWDDGLQVGGGLAAGAEVGNATDFDGVNRVLDGFVRVSAPVSDLTDALVLLRYQSIGENTIIATISLGFTAGLAL